MSAGLTAPGRASDGLRLCALASFAPAPRDSSFSRVCAPGGLALPPPAVFPPSEKGPHSGACLRTAAGQIEGGIPAAARRGRARSAFRSRDRGSCCALPGLPRSGSSGRSASRGNYLPGRRDGQRSQARACRIAAPPGTAAAREARGREGLSIVCSCNPWANKKTPGLPAWETRRCCRPAIASGVKQKRRSTPTL